MSDVSATSKCEYKFGNGKVCARPASGSFGSPSNLHYFCDEHLLDLAVQVMGRKATESPKPKSWPRHGSNRRTMGSCNLSSANSSPKMGIANQA